MTRDTSFSSSNTGVISVQNTPGQTGNGMASFNTVGSVNITGSISFRGDDGSEPPPICPKICPLLFLTALIPGESKPRIDSIAPARGLIGNTTSVTIGGRGFGLNPTVSAGTGITVSITSASDVQIRADFIIATNAPTGDHGVTVAVGVDTSNSVNFFVQVPNAFSGLAVTSSSEVCLLGTSGVLADVRYQVVDPAGNPINKSGMTPQEHFTVNGVDAFPGFRAFAIPPTTDAVGILNDIPVGTCFGPPMPAGNPCVNVVQTFNIRVQTSGGEMIFPIITQTTRRDCALGIRVQVSPGSTFTIGTVN